MKKKIVGIFVMTLLITTTVLPVIGTTNTKSNIKEMSIITNGDVINVFDRGSDSGGTPAGVRVRQHAEVHQNKFDVATDLHFKIWQKEDNIDINGWNVQISGFPDVDSNRGDQPEPWHSRVDNSPDVTPYTDNPDSGNHAVDVDASGANIPRCTWIKIDWTYWLSHMNKKRVADFKWTTTDEDKKGAPNHGWGIKPPQPDPNIPGKYKHFFYLTNDEETDSITICNLSFLTTMDWYENLSNINFPSPYDCYTLDPGESIFMDINTTSPFYGGHIYFKYEIMDSYGRNAVFKDVADHPITPPMILDMEPSIPFPMSCWETNSEGLTYYIIYNELSPGDVYVTFSYTSLYEPIGFNSLTYPETQDLPWTYYGDVTLIPDSYVELYIPLNMGDTAGLLRYELSLSESPGDIIVRGVSEAIISAPFPYPSEIKDVYLNWQLENYLEDPIHGYYLKFISPRDSITPNHILEFYDPPGPPYLEDGVWFGGYGCPPIEEYFKNAQADEPDLFIDNFLDPGPPVVNTVNIITGCIPAPGVTLKPYADSKWKAGYRHIPLTFNRRPLDPSKVTGPTQGNPGLKLDFETYITDPDGDNVYYWYDWGDGTKGDWYGPIYSGYPAQASHIWDTIGTYEIKVKAKDSNNYESDWSEALKVVIKKSRETNRPVLNFLHQHLSLFPFLQKLLLLQR